MTTADTRTAVQAGDEPGPLSSEQLKAAANKRLLLAVCCVAQFMVILDLSIVNVALPSIQSDLLFSPTGLQWVINAYALVFAGFLMFAGRAADMFGHRRAFAAALMLFALASLIGGIAPTSGVLIAARALQGLGGAGMAASSLAIITSSFAAGPERHRAIALWGAMNGLGGAAGMLFGGIITDVLSWRWVLLINVPIGIGAALLAARIVVDRKREHEGGFDILGALLLTSGLLVSAYGAVNAGTYGWDSIEALGPIVFGSLLIGLFTVVERHAKDPLIPLKALTSPLKRINTIVLLFSAAIFPMWFLSTLYLQQVLALSPLETGLTFLPMALAIFVTASQAGKLVARAGVRAVLGGGLILMSAGMALFGRIGAGGSAIEFVMLPGLLMAIGIGLAIVPSTIAATQSAAPEQAGLASGLVNTARQVGGGLGLAVLISIATLHTSNLIGDGGDAAQSLTDGFRLGYLIGAGFAALAAVLTFVLLPRTQDAAQKAVGRRVMGIAAAAGAVFIAIGVIAPRGEATPIGNFTLKGAQSFVSEPGLHPPELTVEIPPQSKDALPGLILTANFYDLTKPPMVGQSGPLILDEKLQPVWFKPVVEDVVAANLEAHTYKGKPVLTYWQGKITPTGEVESGEVVMIDERYNEIVKLKGADDWVITLHELVLDGDTAWVTANKNVRADLSEEGGVKHGVLLDSAVQRYDLNTGELLYSWTATDHIAMKDSYTQPPPNGFPWDAYHVNSIDLAPDGRFIVSMRNTWAAYMVDSKTNEIDWQLGGKQSSFDIPEEAEFEWQHDVTLRPDGTIALFDNHCCEITGAGEFLPAERSSRVLMLELDEAAGTATQSGEYSHGAAFRAQYMGNYQFLDNGNVFVSWGQVPFLSSYSKSGELQFDGSYPVPNMTYRSYVAPWDGMPTDPPKAVIRTSGGKSTLYASWNGATKLASWKVLGGGPAETFLAEEPKAGFETAIDVPQGSTNLTLQALDADGKVLATAPALAPKG